MRFRLFIGLLLGLTALAGCQGAPPEVVYIVLSPTPETTQPVTDEAAATEAVTSSDVPPSATLAATATAAVATTATPAATAAVGSTELPPNFPTPVIVEVQVAEQLFEHGRMFWIEPIQQIWVMHITGEGRGTWSVYEDTFVEGEPETDPNLVPPEGRYQPERGFGKLWRESGNLREELGWGVTPEFGYVSRYEYHAGGSVDASGNFVAGPGYHIVFSLGGELFRFNEADGTWQLGNN